MNVPRVWLWFDENIFLITTRSSDLYVTFIFEQNEFNLKNHVRVKIRRAFVSVSWYCIKSELIYHRIHVHSIITIGVIIC